MTRQTLTLTFGPFAFVPARASRARALRILLKPGELLRLPRKARTLRVVAGAAWVTQEGLDHLLEEGATLALAGTRRGTLVSAEGRSLFLEIS